MESTLKKRMVYTEDDYERAYIYHSDMENRQMIGLDTRSVMDKL